MKECDNSKIHISNNFLLSICLLIMLDTLLLVSTIGLIVGGRCVEEIVREQVDTYLYWDCINCAG